MSKTFERAYVSALRWVAWFAILHVPIRQDQDLSLYAWLSVCVLTQNTGFPLPNHLALVKMFD